MFGSAGLHRSPVPISILSFEVLLKAPNSTSAHAASVEAAFMEKRSHVGSSQHEERSSQDLSTSSRYRYDLSQDFDSDGFWVPATLHPAEQCADGGKSTIKIGVTSFYDHSAQPVAVRYAHGDFPTGIIHNVEGLPVAPFVFAVNSSLLSR